MSTKKKPVRGKLKRLIAGAAPKLAQALGGPLAGAAMTQISKAIFGNEHVSEEQLGEALGRATPEQILALKRAEHEFELALRQAAGAEYKIDAEDRASARLRQVQMRDWTPSALGALIILGFFIVLAAMLTRQFPNGAETEFSIMLGALATMTAAVVNFFFGSSSGSKEKTRLLAEWPGEGEHNRPRTRAVGND